jgi:hypothetical protein
LRRWVTGTPPVTHIYIKPSSNQRSTTSREASAAGRLRPNAETVHVDSDANPTGELVWFRDYTSK